jgi:cell cycle arrest protein BUB2
MRYCPVASHARRSNGIIKVTSIITLCDRLAYSDYSPMRLLRTFPPLEAVPVIGIAVTLVRDLPADLYDELVRHPYEITHI